MTYIGIDYGRGVANVHPVTKIRYGCISINTLHPEIVGEADPIYPSEEEYGGELDDFAEPVGLDFDKGSTDYKTYYCESLSALMIIESPYFTYAQFCSPCVPGAGDLNSINPDGAKTYCLGHDWFEDDTAPYPVYSVETGEVVEPKKE